MPNRARLAAALVVASAACAAGVTAPSPASPTEPVTREATVEEVIRIRCALDGRDVVTTWTGSIYAFLPQERPRHLFEVVGMNVARCLRHEGGWHLTSRELMFYLDPAARTPLHRWVNPWTAREVPVVHVANRLIQSRLGGAPLEVADGLATVVLDIPLFYPHPFAASAELRPYNPEPSYQGGEFFALTAAAPAASDPSLATVPSLTFGWHRLGPWLPWMDMGATPGVLFYRARGHKVDGLERLAPLLRQEIAERVPLYASAPRCVVARKNETSWTYFARALPAYLRGERFPLTEPIDPDECAVAPLSPAANKIP